MKYSIYYCYVPVASHHPYVRKFFFFPFFFFFGFSLQTFSLINPIFSLSQLIIFPSILFYTINDILIESKLTKIQQSLSLSLSLSLTSKSNKQEIIRSTRRTADVVLPTNKLMSFMQIWVNFLISTKNKK